MLSANVRIALRALQRHRLRSALTMLGIIIGVGSVVAMVAVGRGAQERVADHIKSLGANLIAVSQGSVTAAGVRLGAGAAQRLTEDDAVAIENHIPGVVVVAPTLFSRVQFSAGQANWAGTVRGVTPSYFVARNWSVAEGREMSTEDHERAAKVVLLGATVRDKLFSGSAVDPVGTTVRLRGTPYTVAGILERKGQSLQGDDQDDVALVPLSTARQQLVGVNRASPRFVYSMFVKLAEDVAAADAMHAVADLLRDRHRVQPGQDDGFQLQNLAEVDDLQQAATRTLATLLAIVGSVSLLVGGIGIMNIMLVSVTERTREIGLRLAVGARRRDILVQFLVEAVVLALFGGAIGALAGIVGSHAVSEIAGWSVSIDLPTLLVAIAFAGAIGIFFGFYPARQASRLDPIVALRYEI